VQNPSPTVPSRVTAEARVIFAPAKLFSDPTHIVSQLGDTENVGENALPRLNLVTSELCEQIPSNLKRGSAVELPRNPENFLGIAQEIQPYGPVYSRGVYTPTFREINIPVSLLHLYGVKFGPQVNSPTRNFTPVSATCLRGKNTIIDL